MTRDEAIEKVNEKTNGGRSWSAAIVDAMAALGLLSLREPKTAEDELSFELFIRGVDADKVFGALSSRGLKVVRC